MHTPVAAVPGVAHLVPSVAPLAHTNETIVSSSPQRTVSVPVTRRKAGAGPGSPFGPGGPAGPSGPAGACGPCAPAGPASPCGPCAPVGPAGPCGPGTGWPHPPTDQQCAPACIHQLSTVKKPKVCDVRFSNRPVWVKRFQTIHRLGVDVAHGLALLFGIGTRALPSWGSRTRRNNLLGGLAVV